MDFDTVETTLLKNLYQENDYPSDRLFRDKRSLRSFTREFNRRAGANRSDEEIAHELERIRKSKSRTGGLPRITQNIYTDPMLLDMKGAVEGLERLGRGSSAEQQRTA